MSKQAVLTPPCSRLHPGPNLLDRSRSKLSALRGKRLSGGEERDESKLSTEKDADGSSSAQQRRRRQLADQPWFHGRITRLRAQSLLQQQGQFLVSEQSFVVAGFFPRSSRWVSIELNVTNLSSKTTGGSE